MMTPGVDITRATDDWIGMAAGLDTRADATRLLREIIGQPSDVRASQCFDDEEWPGLTVEQRVVEIRQWLALEAPTDRRCGTCKWYDPENEIKDDEPADRLSWCEWPAESLPWSLRWGNRERLMVGPLEGKDCSQWRGGRYVKAEA